MPNNMNFFGAIYNNVKGIKAKDINGVTHTFVEVGDVITVEPKQVNFLDYDGTVVYSYTAQEANALTELPPNPSHHGLISQGWNWTLAEIKSQLTDAPGGYVEVGQNYVTDDNKTRLYIYIEDTAKASELTFNVCFSASVVGGVTIDWGDGNTETNTATTATVYPHTYASRGYYVVTLQCTSGTYKLGGGSSSLMIFGPTGSANSYNYYRIYKVELGGTGLTETNSYCFSVCRRLKTITIPTSFKKFVDRSFQNCNSFKGYVMPRGISLGTLVFNRAGVEFCSLPKARKVQRNGDSTKLERVTITPNGLVSSACYGNNNINSVVFPSSMTEIPIQAFYNCTGLRHIEIPASVTSIASEAFRGCYNILEYHLKSTTPPTLSNTNAFTSINANCVFYVPYSSDHSVLTEYQTASNWVTYASYMQEEPQS